MPEPLILVINPGSTSTKAAVYRGETQIAGETIRHPAEELSRFSTIIEQKALRTKVVLDFIRANGIGPASLSAVVGRGGMLPPLSSGVYAVNEAMLRDLRTPYAMQHASSLGGVIAHEVAAEAGVPAYIVDPVSVDEMEAEARLSGLPEAPRVSLFHALNQKAVARALGETLGIPYAKGRFVVAHMGGGVSVGAHRYGRVIDVNDALHGEGPFSPERTGGLPLAHVIRMCYSGEFTQADMIEKIERKGGILAYLGTNDLREVERRVADGDGRAALVLDAMAYQVAKEIGAMTAALEGLCDAILLTGGMARCEPLVDAIRRRVERLAPVFIRPGEDEMLALAQSALRALSGLEAAIDYTEGGNAT